MPKGKKKKTEGEKSLQRHKTSQNKVRRLEKENRKQGGKDWILERLKFWKKMI